MAKRRLMFEVDCGKRRCKACERMTLWPDVICDVFSSDDVDFHFDAKGRPMRLSACLAAERDAAPLVDAETLEEWETVASYVNGGGAAHYEHTMARALLAAVAALRRQHEPAGGFVEAPTQERVPVVLFGEGKVRP